MSHVVEIQTEVRDPAAIAAACQRLGLAAPTHGTAKLYSAEASGWIVQLPGWRYPVVCNTANGEIKYDNFQGHWGDQAQLGKFMQAYAVERSRLVARQQGNTVYETPLPDGSIKVTIQIGGAA